MKQKWIWIGLGIFAILLRWILGYQADIVEAYYARGIYLGIRKILDYTIGLLPFPVVYLMFAAVLYTIIYGVIWLIRNRLSWEKKLQYSLLSIAAFLGGAVFFFLFLWGFNYARVPIGQQLGIELMPLTKADFVRSLETTRSTLIDLRHQLGTDSITLTPEYFPNPLKQKIQSEVQGVFRELNYPYQFTPKVQLLYPKGTLLRWSTLGVYFPWTGECNLDAGLHPVEIPHVMAHELAHGYGIGDEGTCNFIAYLACIGSDDIAIRYAGYLEYFATLFANYRKYDAEGAKAYLSSLSPAIKADWNAMIENHRKYPNLFPKLRRATYDTYLKIQGIEQGVQNYDEVLMLVKAWESRK
jgi:hypothetical protein